MKSAAFWGALAAIFAAGLALTGAVANEYYYNALYLILQAALMAIAWNILGGFTGYVNFGSAGFFAIVVLGGMGSIKGMFIAALILGIVESMVATFAGPSWSPAVAFGLLALTLALRPAGLFGRR